MNSGGSKDNQRKYEEFVSFKIKILKLSRWKKLIQ